VLKRGLQRHGTFKHGQAEEGGRNNGGRWRAVSPPLRVPQQRPASPPPSEDAVAGPNTAPPLPPAHELLLKEKMRLVTRPTQRFLITCGVKLPVRVFFIGIFVIIFFIIIFIIIFIFIIVGSDLQQLTLVVGCRAEMFSGDGGTMRGGRSQSTPRTPGARGSSSTPTPRPDSGSRPSRSRASPFLRYVNISIEGMHTWCGPPHSTRGSGLVM
jgi:hypothetical protein